jgi:hypothetical protein
MLTMMLKNLNMPPAIKDAVFVGKNTSKPRKPIPLQKIRTCLKGVRLCFGADIAWSFCALGDQRKTAGMTGIIKLNTGDRL